MVSSWLDGESEPLPGDVRVRSGSSWDEDAIADRGIFEKSLHVAGVSENEIQSALAVRDGVAERVGEIDDELAQYRFVRFFKTPPEVADLYRRRNDARQQLLNLFKQRTFQVEFVADREFRIPLFVLSAAHRPGCRAQFSMHRDTATQIDGSIKVFGTGLGGSGEVTLSSVGTFSCAQGETKVVFVPVSVPLEKVTLHEQGRPVQSGWRIDATKISRAGAPGVRLLPRNVAIAQGPIAERYPLLDDPTGAIAEYIYEYAASVKMAPQVGISAPGVDLSLSASVEIGRSATLTFGLRGGFDYELHFTADGQGALWSQTGGRSTQTQRLSRPDRSKTAR